MKDTSLQLFECGSRVNENILRPFENDEKGRQKGQSQRPRGIGRGLRTLETEVVVGAIQEGCT